MATTVTMLVIVAVRMAFLRCMSVNEVAQWAGEFCLQPLQNARQALSALKIVPTAFDEEEFKPRMAQLQIGNRLQVH